MKTRIILTLLITVLILQQFSCSKKEEKTDIDDKSYIMQSRERKESYVFGTDIAKMIKSSPDYKQEFSRSAFIKAYNDLFSEKDLQTDIFAVREAFQDRDSLHIRIQSINAGEISDDTERYSYIYGLYHADRAYLFYETFNLKAFLLGFDDEFNDLPGIFSVTELDIIRKQSRNEISEFSNVGNPSLSIEEKERINKKYLDVNSRRESVKVLPSGLQYIVITEGKGPSPGSDTQKLRVNYRGMLIDGRIFFDTYETKKLAEFEIAQVIPGWREGLKLMNVGSKYKFFIPSELAYGKEGLGNIPPNSTVIYEVELIEIVSTDNNNIKSEEK